MKTPSQMHTIFAALWKLLLINRDAATKLLLRRAVFLWWMLFFLVCLPYANQLWGAASFSPDTIDSIGFGAQPFVEGARIIRDHPVASTGLGFALSLAGLFSIAPLPVGIGLACLAQAFALAGPHIADGGNNIASILLVYVSFFRTGAREPGNAAWRTSPMRFAVNGVSNAALILARLQIALVYLCAGIYKASGELWQNGTALYYVLQVREYSNAYVLDAVRQFPALSVLGSFSVIAFQLAFAFLVWRPKARPSLFLFGILFHLGIWVAMGLPLFALIMCFTYLAFLPGATSRQLTRILLPEGKVVAAFDSRCQICMRFARLVSTLDWGNRIHVDDARVPRLAKLQAIPAGARLEVMYSVAGEAGIIVSGFESVASILARLPLFVPFRPIVALLLTSGFGEWLYGLIARSRTRDQCRQGACEWKGERPA